MSPLGMVTAGFWLKVLCQHPGRLCPPPLDPGRRPSQCGQPIRPNARGHRVGRLTSLNELSGPPDGAQQGQQQPVSPQIPLG